MFLLPHADLNSSVTNFDISHTQAGQTGANLVRLTPPPPPSESKQVNYTRLERLLHRAVPQPQDFVGSFSSLCWYSTLDFKSVPNIFSLRKKVVNGNLTQEQSRFVVSAAEAERNDKRLVCLPSVFVPSFPKCGSTSLFNTLVTHPFIQHPETKETHYFVRFPFQNDDDIDYLSVLVYLRNFNQLGKCSEANHKCLSIDGSQSLLWDTRTSTFLDKMPLLISRVFSRPKFIVILREPVARFHSDFWFFAKRCVGHSHKYWARTIPRLLHHHVTEELDKIQRCLQEGNEEEICIHYSLVGTPNIIDDVCGEVRVGVSVYYIHIARWLRTFPMSSFHFVKMEDLMAQPYAVVKGIWSFLDIPPIEEEKFKMNIQPSYSKTYPKLLPATEKALADFYKPYNVKLSQLLKDDRYLWQDVNISSNHT